MQDTYRGGYLKALLDVRDMFSSRSEALSFGKCITKKDLRFVDEMMAAMITARELIMTYGSAGVEVYRQADGTMKIVERKC